MLGGGDERLWLAAGVVVGIGLQNKHLPLLLVLALAVGLALDRRLLGRCARHGSGPGLRSRWRSGFRTSPGRACTAGRSSSSREDIRAGRGGREPRDAAPAPAPAHRAVPRAGARRRAVGALPRPALRPWRSLGFAYLVAPRPALRRSAAKPYYAAPFLLCLLAPAGACLVERWLTHARRASRSSRARSCSRRGLDRSSRCPCVPADQLEATPIADLNEDAIETVGWPELARTVARRVRGPDRARAGDGGRLHGELRRGRRDRPLRAGARAPARVLRPQRLRALRHAAGLGGPGHRARLRRPVRRLPGCRPAATIDNGVDLENEEQGGTVFVCEGPREPWSAMWTTSVTWTPERLTIRAPGIDARGWSELEQGVRVPDVYATIAEADPAVVEELGAILELAGRRSAAAGDARGVLREIVDLPARRAGRWRSAAGRGRSPRRSPPRPVSARSSGVDPSPVFIAKARELARDSRSSRSSRATAARCRSRTARSTSLSSTRPSATCPSRSSRWREAARVLRPRRCWPSSTATTRPSPCARGDFDPLQACAEAMGRLPGARSLARTPAAEARPRAPASRSCSFAAQLRRGSVLGATCSRSSTAAPTRWSATGRIGADGRRGAQGRGAAPVGRRRVLRPHRVREPDRAQARLGNAAV